MGKAMITNNINSVLNQMQSIEAMAKNQAAQTVKAEPASGGSFADMMQNAVNQVNESQKSSAELGRAFELGDPNVDLAQVMIAGQKSRVAFQALTEVRNKLLSAYQDVMNMPV